MGHNGNNLLLPSLERLSKQTKTNYDPGCSGSSLLNLTTMATSAPATTATREIDLSALSTMALAAEGN